MGSRVELFEQIRRDREREGLSKRALAAKYGVHRRTVRQALESAVPPTRKRPVGRPAPALGAYRALIDSWLEADRRAPRKQRHTARRIWRRLVDERGDDRAVRHRRGWWRTGVTASRQLWCITQIAAASSEQFQRLMADHGVVAR